MTDKRRIFLPHGQNRRLAELTEVPEGICAKYVKGWFDEHNQKIAETAERVRNVAIEECGGVIAGE